VYQGEKVALIMGPTGSDRITAGQTVQVVGSAYVDDFAKYTLDVGQGDTPATWSPITDGRAQAVDKALLGVWNTTGLAAGRYRLRLRVFDSFNNAQESAPLIVNVSPPATPTPQATATPAATPTRGPTSTAGALTATPGPTRPPTPRPTPRP
jgi:hypothetical protein